MALCFFPRASERRVLLKMEVCYSIHLHMLTFSQPHMFTYSHLHIFLPSPSHTHTLTSSHLLIFTSSLSLSRPLSRSLSFFFFSLLVSVKAAGSADEAPRYGHLFARNEVRVSKTNDFYGNLTSSAATVSHQARWECQKLMIFCDFGRSGGNPFARNDVWVSKTEGFLRVWLVLVKGLRVQVLVCSSDCL